MSICKYCGREFKSNGGLKRHEQFCKLNPNQEKDTTEYRRKQSEHLKGRNISPETRLKVTITTRSQEFRKRMSETLKSIRKNKPELFVNSCWGKRARKQSYAEKYFKEVLDKKDLIYTQELCIGRYKLDFAFEDLMIDLEIDGEQHYTIKGVEHDLRRAHYLEGLGWRTIKVRWSEFKSLSNEEKKGFVENLVKILMGE